MNKEQAGISIVITVYNNAGTIRDLLESLVDQEGPKEIVIVDSESSDGTSEILKDYASRYQFIRHFVIKCTRGAGRNIGVDKASFPFIAFTDGDTTADPEWISHMRECFLLGNEMVIGTVKQVGSERLRSLPRVELVYGNIEVTAPSANLGYSRRLFLKLGGFDENFITAEDIDLNIRCVESGARIGKCNECIVFNRTRESLHGMAKQAFWNGYGRKQLSRKHPDSWSHLKRENVFGSNMTLLYFIRSFIAFLGYLSCTIFDSPRNYNTTTR
ncbi:MAG: glycosyltransferase [Thermoplasmataceae archaeon]